MRTVVRGAILAFLVAIVPACGPAGDTFVIQQVAGVGNGTGGGSSGPGYGGAVQPDLVFLMDRNVDGILELFSADAAGTTLVNLSGPLTAGGQVLSHSWSPDRQWVAFIADKDVMTRKELFVVPATGGTPVKVCGSLLPGRDVGLMAWAPDSSRIAYLADDLVDDRLELFSVRPDGTGKTKLSGTLPTGSALDAFFSWAPDSSRIAFTGNLDDVLLPQLYTVVPDGSAARVLVSPIEALQPGFGVQPYRWAPDSSRIAYFGFNPTFDLYTTLPTGTAGNVKVSGTAAPGAGSVVDFAWSPDSSRIAYRGDLDVGGTVELYTTLPTGAGSVLKVSVLGASEDVFSYEWSPSSTRLGFIVRTTTTFDLHTADPAVAGSGTLAIAECLFFRFAPNGLSLGFIAKGSVIRALFVSAPDGTGKAEVQAAGVVCNTSFAWSPSGSKLAYNAQKPGGVGGVFTVDPAGTNSVDVTSALVTIVGSGLSAPVWMADGSRLGYFGDGEVDTVDCLYTSTPTGSPVRVSGTIFEFADVTNSFEVR